MFGRCATTTDRNQEVKVAVVGMYFAAFNVHFNHRYLNCHKENIKSKME